MATRDGKKRAGAAYRLLLRVLPAKFRALYGGAMEETFAAAQASARTSGVRALARLYRRELLDVMRTGIALRVGTHRREGGQPAGWLGSATLRDSLRMVRRQPFHAVVCVVTLALAVAAATASHAIVSQALFAELPFAHADELVVLSTATDTWKDAPVSAHVLEDLRASDLPLTGYAPIDPEGVLYVTPTSTEPLFGLRVSSEFFDIVDAPSLGRRWSVDERDVVIVSHAFWQRALGGASNAVGRQIILDGSAHTVVGVMPESFAPPFYTRAELVRPLDLRAYLTAGSRPRLDFTIVARLGEGTTSERLDAALATFSQRLQQQHPVDHARQHWWAMSLRARLVGEARPALLGMGAAALLLLLIVCANMAGVSAARAVGIRHVLAVQNALGATRARLLQERIVESFTLSALGSALGVWLGFVLFRVVAAFQPQFLPALPALTLDANVLVLGFLVGLLAGTISAVVPYIAVIGGRLNALASVRGSTGTASLVALRSTLVVVQVAIALVLVVGAGLLVRTVQNLAGTALGYRTERLYTVEVSLPAARYTDAATVAGFEQAALERLHALPGVAAATASVGIPIIGGSRANFVVRGRGDEHHEVAYFSVAPNFMRTLQVPVRAGRDINTDDRAGAPRAILVNGMTARQVWPNGDAVGAQIAFGTRAPTDASRWATVVGIVADIRQHGPTSEILPTMYTSTQQSSSAARRFTIAVRGDAPPAAEDLRAMFHEIDSGAAMGTLTTLDDLIDERTAPQRLVMLVLLTLGLAATVMCAVGLYAVVSLTLSMRFREYAIRLAIGAEPRGVRWLVLRQAIVLGGLGIAGGLAVALPGTRALQGLLHGVTPLDLPTYAGAVALVLLLALIAAWVPAAKSGRVSATEVMK